MRFMILVKASEASEAGVRPGEELIAQMTGFHEELARAGVLLDASGLQPSAQGWRVRYSGGRRTLLDGPFAEANGLVAGYTLIQARSREEALAWVRRFPDPGPAGRDAEIEVRQLMELDELPAGAADA